MVGRRHAGFTLIELLVVLAIVGLLLSIVAPRYIANIGKSEETVLQHNLLITRDAIDKFHGDKGRYPKGLDELVSEKYLRTMPHDPVARSDLWLLQTAEEGGVQDLHSTAPGTGRNGHPYRSW